MTFEEIKKALETTPEIVKQVVSSFKDSIIKELEPELVIRTKEEDESYVAAKLNSQLSEKIKAEFGKTMDGIDARIKEITGVEKTNGEKTTDYLNRVIGEIKNKGVDPVQAQRVKDLETQLEAAKAAQAKLEGDIFNKEVDMTIGNALDKSNFFVPPHLKTEEERNSYISAQRELITLGFKKALAAKRNEDGSLVFYEGETPQISTKDGKPLSATDLISQKYQAYFVPAAHSATGTGTGQQGAANTGTASFKSTDDVHAYLKQQGIEPTQSEYMQQFKTLVTEHKISV